MSIGLRVLLCLLAFQPIQAWACLAEQFETYVFVAAKPDHVPEGVAVLRVQAVRPDDARKSLKFAVVQILEPSGDLKEGQLLGIEADIRSDCFRWGAVDIPAYVVGHLWSGRDGTPYLQTISLKMRRAVPKPHRRSEEELDSYIVDPAWRELAQRVRAQ